MAGKRAPSESLRPKSNLQALLEPFLESLRIRGFSDLTVRSRKRLIGRFCAFASERGVENPTEVSGPMLERYQGFLFRSRTKEGKPLSFSTQSGHLSALKMFFKWLCKNRYIPHNPAFEITMPKRGHRLPRATLTVTEVETLLAQPDVNTPLGLRDRTILEVFYSTAIRRGELLRLCLSQLDIERGMVFIDQGKGKKDRYVPIGERALQWVQKYLQDGRPHLCGGKEERELFLSRDGAPMGASHLSERIRRYCTAAGLTKKGSCHLFRHSAATLMLEGGADIRFIQLMLGHSELSSTQVYTHVSAQKLKDVHTRTHPAKAEPHVSQASEPSSP
jgi:integrase/recombinase XerD